MNKGILTLTLTLVMGTFGFNATAQENKKAKEARKEIKEGEKDLKKAEKDSIADFREFKKDALAKIRENQIEIVDLKIDKSIRTEVIKAEYDKKIVALEDKNTELKNRMEGCSYNDITTWEAFKTSFGKDLSELQLNIKNATTVH